MVHWSLIRFISLSFVHFQRATAAECSKISLWPATGCCSWKPIGLETRRAGTDLKGIRNWSIFEDLRITSEWILQWIEMTQYLGLNLRIESLSHRSIMYISVIIRYRKYLKWARRRLRGSGCGMWIGELSIYTLLYMSLEIQNKFDLTSNW